MTMSPVEKATNSFLRSRIREANKQWLKDWGSGLGSCNLCDKEYTDIQAIVYQEISHCPGCKEPENKTYYYCMEHGTSGCEECK